MSRHAHAPRVARKLAGAVRESVLFPARPLAMPAALRRTMERAMGEDFSRVRLRESSAAEALDAVALTQGDEIHFAPREFQPASRSGRELIAHELAHVVQQRAGRVRVPAGRRVPVAESPHLEAEADSLGSTAAAAIGTGPAPASPEATVPATGGATISATGSRPVQRKRGRRNKKRRHARQRAIGYAERMRQRRRDVDLGREERERRDLLPRPTAAELVAGRADLRSADYGVAHPELRGIRVRRGQDQSAADYMESLTDVRASIGRLMSRPLGERMLTELDTRTAAVNPGVVGDERTHPLTVADIRSGRGMNDDSRMSQRPRHDGTYASVQRAYRYDGTPGAGAPSDITYDESRPEPLRYNSLGHEMVHAWRASRGLGVSPPDVGPRRGEGILNPPTNPVVANVIRQHAHMQEEFETVGLQSTPHAAWAPNENLIRGEHNVPLRPDYSGARPGFLDQAVGNVDVGTDDRSLWQRIKRVRSPVQSILHHLED